MTQTPLPTENPSWGFFGTVAHHADAGKAWAIALPVIAAATGCPETAVRHATIASRSLNADRRCATSIDSRHGRHFADDVVDELAKGLTLEAAIEAAIRRWMDWTITWRTARETGIPRGLPYLTGFVTRCEIEADAFA